MQRQLAALVEQPSKATFLAARAAVLRHSPCRLTSEDFGELERLLEQNEHEELQARLDALPPAKVLSPRIHFLAAEAALAARDMNDVELERSLFVVVLQGLLATGDGTRGNPYVVCHRADAYDVLAALNREPAGQSLVEQNGRLHDVMLCADGREVWFDVHEVAAADLATNDRACDDMTAACAAVEPARRRKSRMAHQRPLRPARLRG